MVITVALDRSAEDARPWIEAAAPTHPALIDPLHAVADLYNIVNVPTSVWIDERGRVVRPNDVAFGSDTFRALTAIDSGRYLDGVRAWVVGAAGPLPGGAGARPTRRAPLPSIRPPAPSSWSASGFTRAGAGRPPSAHFLRAGELAPHDFTIRRGSMPMRGLDPMGPEFRAMVADWAAQGHRYYEPLPE